MPDRRAPAAAAPGAETGTNTGAALQSSTDVPQSVVESWGRLRVAGNERLGEDLAKLTTDVPLSRGLGRAYGDAALPSAARPLVAGTRLADRILSFDRQSGVLHAEAGLSLETINRLFWPRGFTSPVLPGTQLISLGGMVAADVHGKNHHLDGTFGRHVERLLVRVPGGRGAPEGDDVSSAREVVWCSRTEHPELFRAVLGGMGLTGHVLEVLVRLQAIPSPWIWSERTYHPDLTSLVDGLAEAAPAWPFTVAWADCLGRRVPGVLYRGRWATAEEAPSAPPVPKKRITVPLDAPPWLLNRLTIRAFNLLVATRNRATMKGIVHPEAFFHPLDSVRGWNRIYGRRGFTQYQCVLPAEAGREAVAAFFELARKRGAASFLTVVKDFGDEGEGLLTFPRPGTTISLDLPIRTGIEALVAALNAFVIEAGGRIYLAKDAFTSARDFRSLEGSRLASFEAARRQVDPHGRLGSALSERLMTEHPVGGHPVTERPIVEQSTEQAQ